MATALQPHGMPLLPGDTRFAEMRAACEEGQWAVIHDDGTWTGPYPDRDTAFEIAFPPR